MKQSLLLVFVFLYAMQSHAQEQIERPKLSPLTLKYLSAQQTERVVTSMNELLVYKNIDGQLYLSSLVKVADAGKAAENLKAIGALIGTKAGNIWTVQVPTDKVAALSQVAGLSYVQLDEPVFPRLDFARKTTRVDSVHKGINLPMVYSGKNVVMGVIDFGFDYTHPTFYDTLGTTYRIRRVWEMNGSGTHPAGYAYGHEITDTNIIKAQGTDNQVQSHGTATAGMAAGSGFGSNATSNSKYRGMAYDAGLVLVGVRRDSIGKQWMQSGFSDFIDGVKYIFDYATAAGLPAVVNISWGSQSGPHDGSTLVNQAYDNMTGPGKIVVMSAGNEGEEKIHLSKSFTTVDTAINTFLSFSNNNYKRTWVDVWGDAGKTFCGKVTLYHNGVAGTTTGFYCLDNATHQANLIAANGLDTCFVQFITSTSEFNGKPRLIADIYNKAGDSVGVTVTGTNGNINMWNEYYYFGFPYKYQCSFDSLGQNWAVTGNTITTVSDMGAGQSVLLVGAYASNVAWKDMNNNSWSYLGYTSTGTLVPFSSRGPMIDGRIKPDITAPGLTVATSITSFDTSYTPTGSNSQLVVSSYTNPLTNRKYYYSQFSGTSASSPAAAGIVALILQAKPNITPAQLKDIIFQTAIQDNFTLAIPAAGNNNWGHGKINAYGAVKAAVQTSGVYTFAGKKLDCTLFPNPNNGGFVIDYTGNKQENLNLQIADITGKTVVMENWAVLPGLNRKEMNVPQLPKGIYMVKVIGSEGSVSIKTLIQ